MRSVVIVGGGISGLATAYYLQKAGIRPTLIEKDPQLGGVIRTEVVNGCLVEGGPEAFLAAKPWAMELIEDLGLTGEVIGSNDHARVTYVVRDGKLVPLPEGLMMMAPTRVWPTAATRLVGWRTKIRMALEWFHRKPEAPLPDRSVAQFVRDHYGQEAVDYLTEPLLAGVYGGDPEQMSVRAVLTRFSELEDRYGSLTRGILAERRRATGPIFRALKRGMGQLVDAIAARNPAKILRGSVDSLEHTGAIYRLRVAGHWMEADEVVLACPAHQSAQLVRSLQPELSHLLAGIPYTSSTTVALGYNRADLQHPLNGFGFLVPARERTGILACTWVGTKFDHRVPDDKALIRCFFNSTELSSTDAIETARTDLKRFMGVETQPSFTRISRWPESMAQYTVGHQQRVAAIEQALHGRPGLHLAGNGYYGVGIPDCVRLAKEVASKISGP
jgi:oxygen-dependent protoporphyrinogen oxidase